jgi:hypothetical protein
LPVLIALLNGCASPETRHSPGAAQTGAATILSRGNENDLPVALARDLKSLGPDVDAYEARLLAETACSTAAELAVRYRAVRPAWLHNTLVNAGLKERGLCFHWANDLQAALAPLPVQSLEIRPVVARPQTRREHNALVVTRRGRPLNEGVILDAWRQMGRLLWVRTTADHYPWQALTE